MASPDYVVIAILALPPVCALGCAYLGQRAWRRGFHRDVLGWALGLAVVSGIILLIGRSMEGFLAGLGHLVVALMILAGPVLGLLLGALIGWLRGLFWKGPQA